MMPVFALAITLAVAQPAARAADRRREAAGHGRRGPGDAGRAGWLGSIKTRKQAVAAASGFGGRPAGVGVKKFATQVVELAFVRDRIDRGFGDERVFALQTDEVDGVVAARAAAGPALHWLNGYTHDSR